jgi:serine/threonine-protein kinase OSR1/STK39
MATSFPLQRSSYQFLKAIGSGATSDVFAARCIANGKRVAIKVIDLEHNPTEIENLRAEVAFWSACDHPNVVKYFGSFVERSALYILMEYMEGGSCFEILKTAFRKGIENEAVIATILAEVLKALAYFHEHRRLHRDVKPGNILVNERGEVKIADFGIAASLLEQGQRKRARYTVIGTPCYMAPEVLSGNHGYTEKADIWSLGISAIELSTGSAPYASLYPLEVVVRISNSPPPQLPDDRSHAFREFVKLCLNTQPGKRATASELLDTKFLKQKVSGHDLSAALLSGLPAFEERFPDVDLRFAEATAGPKPTTTWDFELPEIPVRATTPSDPQPARSPSTDIVPFPTSGTFQPSHPLGAKPGQASAQVAADQGVSPRVIGGIPADKQRPLLKRSSSIASDATGKLLPAAAEPPRRAADAPAVVKRIGRFTITAATPAASPPAPDPEAARVEELQAQIEGLREKLRILGAENAALREKAVAIANEVRALMSRK